jgi:hypothetical protein
MGFDPGSQFGQTEGLGQIIVRAQAQPPDFINIFTPCRYDDQRYFLPGSYALYNSKAVYSREHQIDDHQVITAGQGFLQALFSILNQLHPIAAHLQIIPLQFGNIHIIFYHQDFFHRLHPCCHVLILNRKG